MTKSTRNLALSLLALIVLSPAPEPAAAQDGRPNVVLVFARYRELTIEKRPSHGS